jgi:Ser/Thr protein kinase RdoA (MazF antagonist)
MVLLVDVARSCVSSSVFASLCSYVRELRDLRSGCVAKHYRSLTLPKHLLRQLDSFLPPVDSVHTLINDLSGFPSLVHGDLNDDNVLGQLSVDRDLSTWHPTSIIDFADAQLGDRLYDLVALHISVLRCDLGRLADFLRRYEAMRGADAPAFDKAQFAYRMMCVTLLHPVDAMETVMWFVGSKVRAAKTLHEVATLLWGAVW